MHAALNLVAMLPKEGVCRGKTCLPQHRHAGADPQQRPLLLRRGRARANVPPRAALGQRLQGGPAGRPLPDRARAALGGLRRFLPQLQRGGRHPQRHRCRRHRRGAGQPAAANPCCVAGLMSPIVTCSGMAAASADCGSAQQAALQHTVPVVLPDKVRQSMGCGSVNHGSPKRHCSRSCGCMCVLHPLESKRPVAAHDIGKLQQVCHKQHRRKYWAAGKQKYSWLLIIISMHGKSEDGVFSERRYQVSQAEQCAAADLHASQAHAMAAP